LLVTFAPDTKLVAPPSTPPNVQKPTAPTGPNPPPSPTTTTTNGSKSSDGGSSFNFGWKFPFGGNSSGKETKAPEATPKKAAPSTTTAKDAASTATAEDATPTTANDAEDAASATAKASEPTPSKDAKAKTPFTFEPPTIDTKSDEDVINGIDDVINEMKERIKDGNDLLNISPQSLKSPISPKTGNPRRSSKDTFGDHAMKEKTEAKRKERKSTQKTKRERVVGQKRDDMCNL
jgi:hypothetical protein